MCDVRGLPMCITMCYWILDTVVLLNGLVYCQTLSVLASRSFHINVLSND